MNRDHVGMIFKFLPKEEQEELRNLKPEEREIFDLLDWITDKDEKIYYYIAYRPKGLLRWNEIHEEFETLYKDKKIKPLAHPTYVLEFESWSSWYDSFKSTTGNDAWKLNLNRPDYGFEIVE